MSTGTAFFTSSDSLPYLYKLHDGKSSGTHSYPSTNSSRNMKKKLAGRTMTRYRRHPLLPNHTFPRKRFKMIGLWRTFGPPLVEKANSPWRKIAEIVPRCYQIINPTGLDSIQCHFIPLLPKPGVLSGKQKYLYGEFGELVMTGKFMSWGIGDFPCKKLLHCKLWSSEVPNTRVTSEPGKRETMIREYLEILIFKPQAFP